MQEVHGHGSRGHRAGYDGLLPHNDVVLADGDLGLLPAVVDQEASFTGTMPEEELELDCHSVPPQGVHDLVQVEGRVGDVPVLPANPPEVGRDPVGALLLDGPLRHVEDPGSRHPDWQDDDVHKSQLGQGHLRTGV